MNFDTVDHLPPHFAVSLRASFFADKTSLLPIHRSTRTTFYRRTNHFFPFTNCCRHLLTPEITSTSHRLLDYRRVSPFHLKQLGKFRGVASNIPRMPISAHNVCPYLNIQCSLYVSEIAETYFESNRWKKFIRIRDILQNKGDLLRDKRIFFPIQIFVPLSSRLLTFLILDSKNTYLQHFIENK